jgi:hypothetical protein
MTTINLVHKEMMMLDQPHLARLVLDDVVYSSWILCEQLSRNVCYMSILSAA